MLCYFILGILFIYVCVPLLQNFLSIMSAWTEFIVYKFALKVYKIKKEYMPDEEEQQGTKMPMGFYSTDCVGYYIDSQEEEDE